MGITYFKRYRMEYDLRGPLFESPSLPKQYQLLEWDEKLIERHAEAKFQSFRHEIDAHVFPCLGESDGCLRLMNNISRRNGFVPQATWLLVDSCSTSKHNRQCGTIQGIVDSKGDGLIQNIGVVPQHRSLGLGTILLKQAMIGFKECKIERAMLEVTAQNQRAYQLYERLGFKQVRVVYKASDIALV